MGLYVMGGALVDTGDFNFKAATKTQGNFWERPLNPGKFLQIKNPLNGMGRAGFLGKSGGSLGRFGELEPPDFFEIHPARAGLFWRRGPLGFFRIVSIVMHGRYG